MKVPPPGSAGKQAVRGKTLILGLLVALSGVLGGLFWIGMRGGSEHVPRSRAGVGFEHDDVPAPAAKAGSSEGWDGGAIAKTLADGHVRDELRRRILAGWAAAGDPAARDPDVVLAAREGRFLPAPTADGGGMDPDYIRAVVHEDLLPMAGKCYDELLARDATARMTVALSFTIVADEKLGGLVEDVGVEADGGTDAKMSTCLRESMSTLAFRPPAHGGTVSIVYPIEFSRDEPDK